MTFANFSVLFYHKLSLHVWLKKEKSYYYNYFMSQTIISLLLHRPINNRMKLFVNNGQTYMYTFLHRGFVRKRGWCSSGESTCLPPMCPGFDCRTQCHIRVEFVVGSHSCSAGFFSGYSGFSFLLKNQHFQIPIRPGIRGPQVYQSKTV